MCTVSLVPGGPRLRLMCNRDERFARQLATPPSVVKAGAHLAMLPRDPEGGGTWIAATDAGLMFAVLNGDGSPLAAAPSRGRMVLELLPSDSLDDALSRAQVLRTRRWSPHRLLATDGTRLVELQVTGDGVTVHEHPLHAPLMFTSSSLGHAVVAPPRRVLFEQLVGNADDPLDGQDAFHRHRWPDRPHLSVDMRRHDAATQSITIVDLAPSFVSMCYEPMQDLVGAPARLSVPRRVTAATFADTGRPRVTQPARVALAFAS